MLPGRTIISFQLSDGQDYQSRKFQRYPYRIAQTLAKKTFPIIQSEEPEFIKIL